MKEHFLCGAQGLAIGYGKTPLISDICLGVQPGQILTLIGPNGAGKSTLLRTLAGQLTPMGGTVLLEGRSLADYTGTQRAQKLALMAPHSRRMELTTCFDFVSAGRYPYTGRLGILSAEDRQQVHRALELVGAAQLAGRDFNRISDGQRQRILLARALCQQPEVILLDEPTNYLDADGRERLYNLIRRTSATVLVISHDRTLLNQLPAICELSSQGLTYYSGNYDFYKKQKALQQKALTQQLEEKQKALRLARKVAREVEERKAKQNVRGEKNSIKKGIPRIMMGALKNNAENSSSRLSSIHTEKTEKLQAEMSGIKSSLPQTDKLKTDFNASHLHVGKVLVKAKDVNFHYPSLAASPMETTRPEAVKELWSSSLTFQLRSGDRLSLKGKNGSGKTTLLKLIMGELHPTDGVMERAGFTSVYLDQEYSLVRNERSVLQQAEAFNHRHLPEHEVKTILNRYLFPRDVWNKPCGKLSGGEKMRLSFCCLMIADNTPDMFILDEPTNNLDIESIEIITATIRDYAGTVIAISHDREFLKDTGIEREILLE